MIKLREKKLLPKNSISGKMIFKNEKVKTFLDKQNVREYIASRPALQEMLKRVLQVEMEGH